MKNTIRVAMVLLALCLIAGAGTGCTAKAKRAYHLSRADRFFQAGNLGSAEIEYLNVLRFDLNDPRANARLGRIYYDQGRLQRAAYFLGKTAQLTPNDIDARLKLGFIYSSVGQFAQALAEANYVLDHQPQAEEAPILLGEASVKPADVAAARTRLQAMARQGDRAPVEVALGNLALREKDLAAANAAYQKARALDPKSAVVNAALAVAAWAEGDVQPAGALFKAAADASPVRSPRRMQYIRFELQTGNVEAARTALAEIRKAAPDYVPATLVLAEIAAAEKKYDDSAALVQQVLSLDPDNFDALLFQGQLDQAAGKMGQAVADFDRMARYYPKVPQVYFQMATTALAANDSAKAAGALSRAMELNPNYIDATLLLAEIQIRNANVAPAIVALEQLRRQQPKLVRAQLLLADAYRLNERVNDALAIYRNLESAYPTNVQVFLLHGAALLQVRDPAGARHEFERALQVAPDNLPAIEQLVELDLEQNDFAAATQLVDAKARQYPNQITVRLLGAKVELAEGRRDQAEATLQQALQMDPGNEDARLLLAQAYSEAGQTEKALARLNEVLTKDPNNVSALMLMATIENASRDFKAAADTYERVLKIDPRFSAALNNLAYLYAEDLPNLDRAAELAQRARDLLPYDPSTADTYGWVAFRRKAYQAAWEPLKAGAAGLPSVPEVQFHLGMASYMNGDELAARAALQRAWQLSTNFSGRAECGLCLAVLNVDPATADAGARSLLEKRVADQPDDPVAWLRLAEIYRRDGQADKAIAAYEAVLKATPRNLNAMVNLIPLYNAEDPRKAYDLAKAASKLAPYDPEVSHILGRLAFQAGDDNLATSMLQQAVQNRPNDPMVLFDYAQAAYSIGRVTAAQTALRNALAAKLAAPRSAQAQQMLDFIALADAPVQTAANAARLDAALKSDPTNVPALMALAAASEARGDRTAAGQACEKALARYPDFVPAQEQLARLYSADPAKLDRAYELAAKVHNLLPDDPVAGKTLGVIYVLRGDYNRALPLLRQSALRLNSDPLVFYYLGVAQFHLKNRPESKTNLQQALALNLPGSLADSARQMLADLK